jgi:hypothetical protein
VKLLAYRSATAVELARVMFVMRNCDWESVPIMESNSMEYKIPPIEYGFV